MTSCSHASVSVAHTSANKLSSAVEGSMKQMVALINAVDELNKDMKAVQELAEQMCVFCVYGRISLVLIFIGLGNVKL